MSKFISIDLFLFIECEGGTFGFGCNKTCGNCKHMKDCHHVTGLCTHGCDPGYYGIRCTYEQRKSIFLILLVDNPHHHY